MAVLVVGDANPDLVLTGDVVPRFGQAEQDVAAEVALGGSGAIAAAALARLGVDVGIAAAVGDDDLGRLVAARLQARGVARDALQRSAAPTGLSVHLLRDGDRAILTSAGAIADLDVGAACAAIGPSVRHVHLSSVYLIPPLVAEGGRVLDGGARGRGHGVGRHELRPVRRVRRARLAAGRGRDPAQRRGGRGDDRAGRLAQAARDLAAEGATVAVKLGPDGALGVTGTEARSSARAPAAPEVVDTVGAGDAFDAGFLRARLDDRPLADVWRSAARAGHLSLRGPGRRRARDARRGARPGRDHGVIVCAAPNPSVDKLFVTDAVTVGAIHRPERFVARPGGKGLNVARAAHALGGDVVAVALLAGHAGRWIADALAAAGPRTETVWGDGETRAALAVAGGGTTTEFYEAGSDPGTAAWAAFRARVEATARSTGAAWVSISGSSRPGSRRTRPRRSCAPAARRGRASPSTTRAPRSRPRSSAGPELVKVNRGRGVKS